MVGNWCQQTTLNFNSWVFSPRSESVVRSEEKESKGHHARVQVRGNGLRTILSCWTMQQVWYTATFCFITPTDWYQKLSLSYQSRWSIWIEKYICLYLEEVEWINFRIWIFQDNEIQIQASSPSWRMLQRLSSLEKNQYLNHAGKNYASSLTGFRGTG